MGAVAHLKTLHCPDYPKLCLSWLDAQPKAGHEVKSHEQRGLALLCLRRPGQLPANVQLRENAAFVGARMISTGILQNCCRISRRSGPRSAQLAMRV